jgi:hypothetical protein
MRRRTLIAAVAAVAVGPAFGAEPAVVLELFTSQGCSSCPPADALLGQLIHRPGVIALAWHVDYWDRLGWRDPFSSHAATARQQAYAASLAGEVYTPAMVIGGARLEVGSDARAIEAAMARLARPVVPVTIARAGPGLVIEVAGGAGPMQALIVAYDKQHTTVIGAGENGGRRLEEYRIARDSRLLERWDGGARRFEVPAIGTAGQGVVVLVQSADLHVLGAADLPAS